MPRIVKTVRIRTLPDDFCYNDHFVSAIQVNLEKAKMPEDCCVLTACNKSHFIGFQLLYSSLFLSHYVNTIVVDLGMTDKQLSWCHRQKRLTIMRYRCTYNQIYYWQAWLKPLYVRECPYDKIIWLDADGVFKGDLRLLLHMAKDQPLFTSDYSANPKITLNWPELYHFMPIKNFKMDAYPYLNTGLFITDKKRDNALLQEWCYIVMEAISSEHIRDSIVCWDQGACKWALQKQGMINCIHPSMALNHPALDKEMIYPATKQAVLQLLQNVWQLQDARFVHWMGSPKPWRKWGELINLDFSL